MTNYTQTYYHDFYKDTVSTVENLSITRQSLYNHELLSEKENMIMQHAIHILFQKIVLLGNQIEKYMNEHIDSIIS